MKRDLDADDLTKLLESGRRKPIIAHERLVLERKIENNTRQIVQHTDKKYVVEVYEEIIRTHHVIVREFDPDNNYGDAITEFIQP